MALLLMSPRERKRPKLRLRGDIVPAVDVLLTTCGEDVSMILNTVRAVCNIDYPQDRYRIIISDDDSDAHLAEALRPLIQEFPFLFYHARSKTPGVPHFYKAGNLQSAIDLAATLSGGPGEYLATLDADMIPDRDWLRALLPHLLLDEKLGLISPPQVSGLLNCVNPAALLFLLALRDYSSFLADFLQRSHRRSPLPNHARIYTLP